MSEVRLIDQVLDQIKEDVSFGDMTSQKKVKMTNKTIDYAIDKIEIDVIPIIKDRVPKIRFTSINLSDDTMTMIFQDIDKYFENKND